jgi:hypothetical protein
MTPSPTVFKMIQEELEEPPAELFEQPAVDPSKMGTRQCPQFPLDHADIKPFMDFLQSMDGKCKSAMEIPQLML